MIIYLIYILIIRYFERQFELAHILKLPMFLHMRAAAGDFCDILEQNKHRYDGWISLYRNLFE